jgi:hypothetical protein
MTRRSFAVLLVMVTAAFVTGCKSTKDECKSMYGLIDKTKADCTASFPELKEEPEPVPGPKIIIRKNVATLQWYVDSGGVEVLQGTGESAWESQKIRYDFVGTKILDWSVYSEAGSAYNPANYVVFSTKVGSDTYYIEMARTAGDKVKWFITKNTMRRQVFADASLPTDKVPLEFTGELQVAPNSFREELEDVTLDKVEFFRVNK